jgi:hypothetical protein
MAFMIAEATRSTRAGPDYSMEDRGHLAFEGNSKC